MMTNLSQSLIDYAVLDLETTGLDPRKDRILEMGVVIVRGGQIVHEASRLVNVAHVPPEITTLTGITTELARREGQAEFLVMDWLARTIGYEQPIIGHNILNFDRPFLLRAWNGAPAQHLLAVDRFLDTGALYKGMLLRKLPREGERHYDYATRILDMRVPALRWNLGEACAVLRIDTSGMALHRALGDCHAVHALYQRLTKPTTPQENGAA